MVTSMRRFAWLLVLVALGLVVVVSGCLQPLEVMGGQCSADADCDDQKPCTDDACTKGFCENVVLNGAPCGNGLTCDSNGECAGCVLGMEGSQCPAPPPCNGYTCDSRSVCELTLSNNPPPDTNQGDCKKPICSMGQVSEDEDPSDVNDDGEECTDDVCENGMPKNTSKAAGTVCGLPMPGMACDMQGNCVDACQDGVQDGNEAGIDCGGTCPLKCLGDSCSGGAECKSGQCVDGVCCGSACNGLCQSCNIVGSQGTCSNSYVGDLDEACMDPMACDGKGGCKKGIGEPCANDSECFNDACAFGACRLGNGEACGDPFMCASGFCKMGTTCEACVNPGDCSSGQCNNGMCKAQLGAPCGDSTDCAMGICQNNLCKLAFGDSCTVSAQCVSNFCNGNQLKCAACSSISDCGGVTCVSGVCALNTGFYCTQNSQCESGPCAGFPKKCQ